MFALFAKAFLLSIPKADYSILNFECPIVDENVNPIKKCGPTLKTNVESIDSIRYAGFDCVTLANNHFRDYGDKGCITTIRELKRRKIDYVGGGLNIREAQQILYKEINDNKIAIVNFCENEFSIATKDRAGAAPLDLIENYNQIIEARNNSDYVIVIVHGGHEYYQLPSPRMKKLYRHFISIGADAVINHHQHCYSGYEYYKGKPIVYGLGNFCFDGNSKNRIWNEGYIASIDMQSEMISLEVIPYYQCDDFPLVEIISGDKKQKFVTSIQKLNEIISNDDLLNKNFEEWCNSRAPLIKNIFNSYHNRYLNAAAIRGWIGRPTSQAEQVAILNYIACEAHRDVTLNILFKELEING